MENLGGDSFQLIWGQVLLLLDYVSETQADVQGDLDVQTWIIGGALEMGHFKIWRIVALSW